MTGKNWCCEHFAGAAGLVGFRNVNYSNDLPLAQGIQFADH